MYGKLAFSYLYLEFHYYFYIILYMYMYVGQCFGYNCIRKYGSTFYIGIAMVVLPYFGPWEN